MSQLPRYESYKDSGVQWLGEIPSHWKSTRIKFLGDIVLGLTYSPEDVTTSESGTLVLRSSNVQNGVLKLDDNVYVEKNIPKKMVTTDQDILICSRNGSRALIGKCALIEGEGVGQAFGAFMTVLRSPYRKYLYYVLSSDLFKFQIGSFLTSTINQLTTYALGNFEIAFPPLEEQKIITDFLDKRLAQVDALIAKQETLLEKLAEQRVALISHAVTKGLKPDVEMKESGVSTLGEVPLHWEIIKNKFIFDFSKGLTITKENLVDEGIPCVSYGEVHSKFGFEVDPNKHQLKCVPETYIESDENSLLKYGDFIFADTSEDVKGSGNFTYLNSDIPTFAGYHTIIAKMSKLNNPRFLAYILDTEEHRNQIRMLIKGVKVFSITQAILKNTFVWLPPIDEQNQIVDYLDQEVEKYQQIGQRYELTITRLKEYRSTLITQVVTGKIDVRNLKVN